MKKEVLLKRILISIVIMLVFLFVNLVIKTQADVSQEARQVLTFTQLAWKGYENVKALSLEDLYNIRCCDNYGNLNHSWTQTTQVTCMHGSNTQSYDNTAQRPYIIIDINPDGDNPKKGKIYVFVEDEEVDSDDSSTTPSDSNNSNSSNDLDDTEKEESSEELENTITIIDENGKPVTIKTQPETKGHYETFELNSSNENAMLAYICYSAEHNNRENDRWCLSYFWDDSASSSSQKSSVSSGGRVSSYRSYLTTTDTVKNYFGGNNPLILLPNEPNNRYDNKDNTTWNEGLSYIDSLNNDTNTVNYSSRIILFNNGVAEARTVMFGQKNDVEAPKINKYITDVKYPTSYKYETPAGQTTGQGSWEYSDWISTPGRSTLSTDEKKASPVNVIPNSYIKYKIEVSSNVSGVRQMIDSFDSDNFDFVENLSSPGITLGESILGTGAKNRLTANVTLSGDYNRPTEIIIVLKAKDTLPSRDTKYENVASIRGFNAYDYVKCKYTIEEKRTTTYAAADLKKYIIAVNGNTLKDANGDSNVNLRRDYENTYSSINPVVVKKGDIVTYRLEVKDTSTVDIISFNLRDTLGEGLLIDNTLLPSGVTAVSANELTYSFKNISANSLKYIDIPLKVAKSDMYLLTIDNEFTLVSGEYYERKTTYYKYTWDSVYGAGLESDKTIISYSKEELEHSTNVIINSSKNKDYIELDDVDISGVVWQDGARDSIYGNSPTYIRGVNVYLYEVGNPNPIASTTTNENGYYVFSKVTKGNVAFGNSGTRKYADNSGYKNYYVQFGYSGVKYESTIYTDEYGRTYEPSKVNSAQIEAISKDGKGVDDNGTKDNWNLKSHATELNVSNETRQEFNNKFETVANNIAYNGTSGTSDASIPLEYTKAGHTSSLNITNDTIIYANSMILFVQNERTSGGDTVVADDVTYLKNINLGLCPRDKADLDLTKDVYEAIVKVNGYETTYKFDALNKSGTGYTGTYKVNKPYELGIYSGDYEFRTSQYSSDIFKSKGESNDLEVTLVYKVTIKNISTLSGYTLTGSDNTTVATVVREVIDTSSNEMTIVGANTLDGEPLTVSSNSTYNNTGSYSYNGYNTSFVTGANLNTVLAPGQSIGMYLTYNVNKENGNINIDANNDSDLGKVNIAQIGAFSVYDSMGENRKALGLVDNDSNPGNINTSRHTSLTDTSTVNEYEDDTFFTSIKLLLRESENSRSITGNVWEENKNITLAGSGQKTGDGVKYGENGAGNVEVRVMEVITVQGKEYLVDTGLSTLTDSNGNYRINGSNKLHAGQYVVRFIYGNNEECLSTTDGNTIKYSGQDYKSTNYTAIRTASNENEVSEADAFTKLKNENNKILSTAKDNELRRLEVINYSDEIVYSKDNILKSKREIKENNKVIQEASGDFSELAENTAMYADTKKFNIQLEYPIKDDKHYTDFNNYIYNGIYSESYTVSDVNFGLVERPITKLQLMNDITEIIAQTSAGDELLHLYFNIVYTKGDGEWMHEAKLIEDKSIGYQNVQILNRNLVNQGFRYVNIDSDLLQGMTIRLKFKIAIANNSEIDTSKQNLITAVESNELNKLVSSLRKNTETGTAGTIYTYGTSGDVNSNVLSSYSNSTLERVIGDIDNKYKSGTYRLGYFLGNTYYAGTYDSSEDKIVETRVDQIVNYVDNDLVFKPEENVGSNGESQYLNYTIEEILNKNLLKNASGETISDGKESYISDSKNNLAFSTESKELNPNLYKYLKPNTNELYECELSASKTLTSESSLDGIMIDNFAEIVKIKNTVGRKVFMKSGNTSGCIGNSTDTIKTILDDIVTASRESDTDFTEFVTFSPPTGLSSSQISTNNTVTIVSVVVLVIIIILAIGFVIVRFIRRKKIYK